MILISQIVDVMALYVITNTLPVGEAANNYSSIVYPNQQFTAGRGTFPYTWSFAGLPNGLSGTSGGVVSGIPLDDGLFPVTITVVDANNYTASATINLTILAAVRITTTSLPQATLNTAYSQTLTATNGTLSYTWSLDSGSNPLPTGLSLSAGGVVSGTPTVVASTSVTFVVTDAVGSIDKAILTVTVNPPPPSITTTSPLPNATQNSAYSTTIAGTGGTTPYSWSITGGSLPTGLSLASGTGVISGTPTTTGTSSFTVTLTDNASLTASVTFLITVNASSGATLIKFSDLTWQGSFLLPESGGGGTNCSSFSYSGPYQNYPGGAGYNPLGNSGAGSLLIAGSQAGSCANTHFSLSGEVTIPTVSTANTTLASLPRAAYIQSPTFGDLSSGLTTKGNTTSGTPPSTQNQGNTWFDPVTARCFWTCYQAYDNGTTYASHGYSNTPTNTSATVGGSLAAPDAHGMYKLADPLPSFLIRGTSGYVADIPSAWQVTFGNYTHFSGMAGASITGNEGNGPGMTCFKAADFIGLASQTGSPPTTQSVIAKSYLFYPLAHKWSGWNPGVGYTSVLAGGCFIDTPSVYGLLFFGRQQLTISWYGLPNYHAWAASSSFPSSDNIPPLKPSQNHYGVFGSSGGTTVTDGVLNSTTTLTSATANFTSAFVGRTLSGTGIPAGAYISAFTNSTTVTMSAAATVTQSGVSVTIGAWPTSDTNHRYYWNTCNNSYFNVAGIETSSGNKGNQIDACEPVVWIYDPNTVASNISGGGNPWDLSPSETKFDSSSTNNPFLVTNVFAPQAMAYDRAGKRIFLLQGRFYLIGGSNPYPIVHVYTHP